MKLNHYIKSIITICLLFVFSIVFAQHMQWPDKAKNLKVLPKNTNGEELKNVMVTFSRSLGVHCDKCHVGKEGGSPDFASDAKPEKEIARKMMKMVDAINTKYIGKMVDSDDKNHPEHFVKITCVTCHMGHEMPMVSIDSLPKQEKK